MNATELAIDGLAAQEVESLAGCIARGQPPESYQDIVYKVRAHVEKLPDDRQAFWSAQCQTFGLTLFPPSVPPQKSARAETKKKSGGTSVP